MNWKIITITSLMLAPLLYQANLEPADARFETEFTAMTPVPKPRIVFLNNELERASAIAWCEVKEDHLGRLSYVPINAIRPKPLTAAGSGNVGDFADEPGTGYWPKAGEKVLVVINQKGAVTLFANKVDQNYRFWSPSFTGSIALFHYKSPALPMPDCESVSEMDGGEWKNCWDGALYPISKLKEKLK